MSSSSMVSTNIDNNETPVDIEKVTPSQKVSRKRKRISDKFERMEGLMEKMIKIQEDT